MMDLKMPYVGFGRAQECDQLLCAREADGSCATDGGYCDTGT
jgi:hypothetical protein